MLGDFAAKKSGAAGELVQAVDSVLDADPRIEPDASEFGEDGVIVVQAFADLIAASYNVDGARAKVLTMSVFGMINWTFTWLKPGGPLTYAQFAEAVVGMLEGGLNGGAERIKHIGQIQTGRTNRTKKEIQHV